MIGDLLIVNPGYAEVRKFGNSLLTGVERCLGL